jgi:hypothetical protein
MKRSYTKRALNVTEQQRWRAHKRRDRAVGAEAGGTHAGAEWSSRAGRQASERGRVPSAGALERRRARAAASSGPKLLGKGMS